MAEVLDAAAVALVGRAIDDRSHPMLLARGVADAHALGGEREALTQVAGHGFLHVHPRAGRAFLARETEGGARDAERRAVQVGVARDDRGVLAAHLGDARAR